MKVVIILPTYNEKENINLILDKIDGVFNSGKIKGKIVVVDDNSPDDTGNLVELYREKHKNRDIYLIKGEKVGLGDAYIRGFNFVFDKMNSDVIIMMDADLSHDPNEIPKMLDRIRGCDVVVGSKYICGGNVQGFNFYRRMISKIGNFLAKTLIGIKVNDCTSGFRAIRTSFLKKINLNRLNRKGYSFLLSLSYELYFNGAKIEEIPIVFKDREKGETKLRFFDIIECFINLFRLCLKRLIQK